MDVLLCEAALPDRTAEEAVKAQLRDLPELAGPDTVAYVEFTHA
jgi:hypothetical protein